MPTAINGQLPSDDDEIDVVLPLPVDLSTLPAAKEKEQLENNNDDDDDATRHLPVRSLFFFS